MVVNVTVGRLIVGINATASTNAQSSVAMLATIDAAANLSPSARILGAVIAYETEDTTNQVSFSVFGMVAIMSGKRPQSASWAVQFMDPDYPPPSPALPPPDNNSAPNATVGVQAQVFVTWCAYLMRDIANAGGSCEDMKDGTVAPNCSCPNTTSVQDVLSKWNNTCGAIALNVNVTASGTLIAYVNATLGTNITDAVNATQSLLQSIGSCSQCLVNQVKQDNVKMYRSCVGGKSGSGEAKSCGDYLKKCSDQNRRVLKKYANHKRKRAVRKRVGLFQNVASTLVIILSGMDTASSNLQTTSNSLNFWNGGLQIAFNNLNQQMKSFRLLIQILTTSIQNNATVAVNSTQSNVNETLVNATAAVTAICTNLTSLIANDSSLYPTCQNFTNVVTLIQANFTTNVHACMATCDNNTDSISAQHGDILANFTLTFQGFMNLTDKCYANECNSKTVPSLFFSNMAGCLNYYSYKSASVYIPCINNVSIFRLYSLFT